MGNIKKVISRLVTLLGSQTDNNNALCTLNLDEIGF